MLLAALSAVSAPLLFHSSLPMGSDVYAHAHWLTAFMKALGEGDLYPRWTDRTNQGLGAPSFIMFPPLVYYGAAAASAVAGSIIAGFRLYLLVVLALTALSMYALARHWTGARVPAALGAALYLLLPYHVLDLYQRFAVSETTAFVFFPLVLLFARRAVRSPGAGAFTALAASYAGLVYTHIVSALAFSLVLGPWILWETRLKTGPLARAAAGLACGLGLAAPALLPAVIEKSDANIAWVREMPNGDFRANFLFRDEELPGLGFKDPIKRPVLESAHTQLLLGVLAAGVALLALRLSKGTGRSSPGSMRGDVGVLLAGCLVTYFLQLPISTPLWRLIPELASIQFPWRFQAEMSLAASLLAACALAALSGVAGRLREGDPAEIGRRAGLSEASLEKAARGRRSSPEPRGAERGIFVAGSGLLAAAILANLILAGHDAFLRPFGFDARELESPGVVGWIEPAFTPLEFKPYAQFRQMRIDLPQATFVEGRGSVRVERWASSSRRLDIESASGGTVRLAAFWFPGWKGTLDGAPLDLHHPPPQGLIELEAPPGRHTAEIVFAATPVRRVATGIMIAAILMTVLLAWKTGRSGARRAGSPGGGARG